MVAMTVGRLLSQNAADDPHGWTKAKWGATRDQIRELFPDATQVDPWTPQERQVAVNLNASELGLSSFPIRGRKFRVAFSFDKNDRFTGVRLIYEKVLIDAGGKEVPLGCQSCAPDVQVAGKEPRSAQATTSAAASRDEIVRAELNEQIVEDAKDILLNGLVTQYGNPGSDTRDGDRETFRWLFPTTDISLTWTHGQFKDLDAIELSYGERKKSAQF